MSCAMICSTNYLASEDVVNAFAYSSQDSISVGSNVFGDKRAYKTWKSSGYFDITSANNVLIFRETAGVDLTATVAVAEYTSRTALNTAIKTALEAAGVATYTVSVNAQFQTVITSDLSGGATVFEIRGADVLSTIISTLGFSASNLSGAATYTASTVVLHHNEWLEFDFGVATTIQAVIVHCNRYRPFGVSETGTITIQMNDTSNWTSPSYSEVLTLTDFGAYTYNASNITTARRFLRVLFSDPDNVNGYVEISKIFAGNVATFERASAQFGFRDVVSNIVSSEVTIGGVIISDNRYSVTEVDYELGFLTKGDKEILEDIYATYGLHTPLFFIFDDDGHISGTPQRMVRLMRFTDRLSFSIISPNVWEVSISLREEL